MTKYILVVIGNFPSGFMLYGPFASREEANECARQFSQRTCVEELFAPPIRTSALTPRRRGPGGAPSLSRRRSRRARARRRGGGTSD
jgi:hypothetical protein